MGEKKTRIDVQQAEYEQTLETINEFSDTPRNRNRPPIPQRNPMSMVTATKQSYNRRVIELEPRTTAEAEHWDMPMEEGMTRCQIENRIRDCQCRSEQPIMSDSTYEENTSDEEMMNRRSNELRQKRCL